METEFSISFSILPKHVFLFLAYPLPNGVCPVCQEVFVCVCPDKHIVSPGMRLDQGRAGATCVVCSCCETYQSGIFSGPCSNRFRTLTVSTHLSPLERIHICCWLFIPVAFLSTSLLNPTPEIQQQELNSQLYKYSLRLHCTLLNTYAK